MLRFLWIALSFCCVLAFYKKNQQVKYDLKKAIKKSVKINYTKCKANSGSSVSILYGRKDYGVEIPGEICYGLNNKNEVELWYSKKHDEFFYDLNFTRYDSAWYISIISLIASLLPWKLISKIIHIH